MMSGETKLIVITSDEDMIRQFASSENPEIQMRSIESNDLNILDQLIGLNSTDDQIPKRSFDTTDEDRSVKTPRKSSDLICTICVDRAIGYNYGVLSCASCKAFFHRNGQQHPKRLKCLTGQGQCVVDHKRGRKCYRCRLERCLSMGMRRDLILSQEEIHRRRDSSINRLVKKKKKNRSLTAEDLLAIEKVDSSFSLVFEIPCDIFSGAIDYSDDTLELIGCLKYNNAIAFHLIKYCRSINQFESFNVDDRFILIKYNLLSLFCILTCYRVKQPTDSAEDRQRQEEMVKNEIYILCNRSDHLYELVLNLGIILSQIVENDRTLISLLLITFLFSKGLSIDENEPFLKDSLSVYRAQSYYAKLLWNYMIKKHGEIQACQHFSKLMIGIFRVQSFALEFRKYLGNRMNTLDAVDEIAPLMQTILHIS